MSSNFYYNIIDSPIGNLTALADDNFLYLLDFYHSNIDLKQKFYNFFNKYNILSNNIINYDNTILLQLKVQLQEYFDGNRIAFDIPFKIFATDFQQKVYHNLLKIQYGQYCTYKDLAILSGSPKACRAVGNACHNNNIVILIPCHRVVTSNLSLGGYAGGLDNKKFLHNLENISL